MIPPEFKRIRTPSLARSRDSSECERISMREVSASSSTAPPPPFERIVSPRRTSPSTMRYSASSAGCHTIAVPTVAATTSTAAAAICTQRADTFRLKAEGTVTLATAGSSRSRMRARSAVICSCEGSPCCVKPRSSTSSILRSLFFITGFLPGLLQSPKEPPHPSSRPKEAQRHHGPGHPQHLADLGHALLVHVAKNEERPGVRAQLIERGVQPLVQVVQTMGIERRRRDLEPFDRLHEDGPTATGPEEVESRVDGRLVRI